MNIDKVHKDPQQEELMSVTIEIALKRPDLQEYFEEKDKC